MAPPNVEQVFHDPLAITFPRPGSLIGGEPGDHDRRNNEKANEHGGFVSSVRVLQRRPSENNMRKESNVKRRDDLRDEYDLSKLQGGVRGKYYRRATAGTNLVLIEPDLVNHALRVLADAAQTAKTPKRRRLRSD